MYPSDRFPAVIASVPEWRPQHAGWLQFVRGTPTPSCAHLVWKRQAATLGYSHHRTYPYISDASTAGTVLFSLDGCRPAPSAGGKRNLWDGRVCDQPAAPRDRHSRGHRGAASPDSTGSFRTHFGVDPGGIAGRV